MDILNVVKIKIFSMSSQLNEIFLFACKNSGDAYFKVTGEDTSSIDLNEFISHASKQTHTIEHMKEFAGLKFENVSSGTGIIKCSLSKSFLVYFKSPRIIHFLCIENDTRKLQKKIIYMDGYALSLFYHCLTHSEKYVELVTNYLSYKNSLVYQVHRKSFEVVFAQCYIKVKEPERHIMDLTWLSVRGDLLVLFSILHILSRLLLPLPTFSTPKSLLFRAKMAFVKMEEERNLYYIMSWLSTVGGAFSALGDEEEGCARAAGQLSLEQLNIAVKLGNENMIVQCKLFFSLSLVQRGHCRLAKKIIQEQYNKVKSGPAADKKTLNMCKGIWARLKHKKYLKRLAKKKVT